MNENERCAIYPSTHEALSLAGCRCVNCPTFTRRAYSNGIGVFTLAHLHICVTLFFSLSTLFFLTCPTTTPHLTHLLLVYWKCLHSGGTLRSIPTVPANTGRRWGARFIRNLVSSRITIR